MTDGPAVLVEGLAKTYPGGVRAVDGISFEVERGEFFGFLGPNGAGKTTTIKILATLLTKSSGRVEVAGLDVTRDPKAVRQAIGVALQEVGLDDLSKGRDFLELQGLLYGLSRAEARRRAAELLELVGLSSVADRKVGSYSGGMRRRIDLARCPDAQPGGPLPGRANHRLGSTEPDYRLGAPGRTQRAGRQRSSSAPSTWTKPTGCADGWPSSTTAAWWPWLPAELKASVGGDIVHVAFGPEESAGDHVAVALSAVRALPGVQQADTAAGGLTATVSDGGAAAPAIMDAFRGANLSIANLSITRPSLDDVFLQHHRPPDSGVGRRRRRGGPYMEPVDGRQPEVMPMLVLRESYFIYVRNLKTWLAQPWDDCGGGAVVGVHVPVLRRAAARDHGAARVPGRRTTRPSWPPW